MARFVAVLPAAGSSQRAAQSVLIKEHGSKLLVPVQGELVLEKTLSVFAKAGFEYIVLAVPPSMLEKFRLIAEKFPELNLHFIAGGATRKESVGLAVQHIQNLESSLENLYVVVHDAARCFVSEQLLTRAKTEVQKYQAVSAALAVSDTIVEVDDDNNLAGALTRSRLRALQTPQAFSFDLLAKAHQLSLHEEITDDSALVGKIHRVKYFEGELGNKKITYAEDFSS